MMKKHIVCFGDSNTHGYCADPSDCADGGDRFNEEERWPCLLQKKLGGGVLVIEEGLSGRTTVFPDPLHECMSGLDAIYSCLMSHEPVDLLIVMLGTNDTKERFGANAACIAMGMERLVMKAKTVPAWRDGEPNILVVCPPHIRECLNRCPEGEPMGRGCPEKSRALAPRLDRALALLTPEFLSSVGTQAQKLEGDDLFVTRFDVETSGDEGRLFEYHRSYLDIFTLADGTERVDIAAPESLSLREQKGDYWGGTGTAEQSVILTPGSFLVLFPGDAHRPGMAASMPQKASRIVFKIRFKE